MKFVLASNNQGKLREMRILMAEAGLDAEVLSRAEAGCTAEPEETGETFEENARIKAMADHNATGLASIADDSGLCVDALHGDPGVRSARYTGNHEDSDEQRNALLLKNLGDSVNRSARFVSAVCCILEDGSEIMVRGECEGTIAREPAGNGGFGYDPIFLPAGCDGKSMGEISAEEKNAISHRGKAFRGLIAELKKRNVK